jgi:hypothetical protein
MAHQEEEVRVRCWNSLADLANNVIIDMSEVINLRSSSRSGVKNFFLLHVVETGSGAYPGSYEMDTRGSFLGIKLQVYEVYEAYHSPAPSMEVRNMWTCTSTPQTCLWHRV